jgi:hypothetical protein
MTHDFFAKKPSRLFRHNPVSSSLRPLPLRPCVVLLPLRRTLIPPLYSAACTVSGRPASLRAGHIPYSPSFFLHTNLTPTKKGALEEMNPLFCKLALSIRRRNLGGSPPREYPPNPLPFPLLLAISCMSIGKSTPLTREGHQDRCHPAAVVALLPVDGRATVS